MNSITLFLLFCIPLRIFLAWISTKIPEQYLGLFAALLLSMSLGFLYLYFTKGRQLAPEAGGVTWWADYRLLIGLLYLSAAIYAFQGRKDLIWVPLTMDVIFGLIIFAKRHKFV
jgi:hypothetical protein